MLIAFQAFNNITAHRLFTAHCKMALDHYRYQITINFEQLLE